MPTILSRFFPALLAAAVPFSVSHSFAAAYSGDKIAGPGGELIVHPINHATFAVQWSGKTIYVDPVGGAGRFKGLPAPDLVLITHTHPDHLDRGTLEAVVKPQTTLVTPSAVAEQLPAELRKKTIVLNNGQTGEIEGIKINAIPAYNTTPERQKYHPKGRDNGYILDLGGTRVYISGDTEETPEMDALKDINVAFLCMNLPYTMDVEQAAKAVRDFRPKIVYPYHYRGADLEEFQKLVGSDSGVEVRTRDWYASR